MQKDGIVLSKGGKLFKTIWFYNEETDFGEYITTEVTKDAPRYLFDIVELDKDITLRDIFFLLNKHLDIFEVVLGNWVIELTEEALSSIGKQYTGDYDPDEIEYLVLTNGFTEANWGDGDIHSYGNIFPDFGGTGFLLKEEHEYQKVGTRISWGVSFQPISELINIPLRLKKDANILKIDYTVNPKDREALRDSTKEFGPLRNIEYSLGHILYGVVWELSWNGPPEKRDKLRDELTGMVDEIKKPKLEIVSED